MRSNFADRDAQASFKSERPLLGADGDILIPADVAQFWCIDWIGWSYDLDDLSAVSAKIEIHYIPAGGVEGTPLHEFAVTHGGPGLLNFDRQELYHATDQDKAILNEALLVRLVGVVGAVGRLSIRYR